MYKYIEDNLKPFMSMYRTSMSCNRFDQVVAINGHVITSMEDLPEAWNTGPPIGGSLGALGRFIGASYENHRKTIGKCHEMVVEWLFK